MAEAYGTNADIITRNFNRNKERYAEGKHFICLKGDDLKTFRANGQIDLLPNVNTLYLWTEKGAFLHAKSLNTDKAWEVYERLVDSYFHKQEEKKLSAQEIMRIQLGMIDEHEERITSLEHTMNLSNSQQQALKKAVSAAVIKALGGQKSRAYKELSRKVFSECNGDIQEHFDTASRNDIPRIRFEEAVEYARGWEPSYNTKASIAECNRTA